VAMGITGTDVAKEAAVMILTDDNFATIIRAVENGRALYDNLLKYIRFQMGSLFAFIITFLGAALFNILGGIPFQPLQVLWINFTIDVFLSIGLGLGNPTPGLMERPPRKAGAQILPTQLAARLIIIGLIIAACTLGVMQYAVAGAHWSTTVAQTMGMTVFSLASIFFALETNDELRSVFSRETIESTRLLQMCGWSLLATFLVTAPDFMQRIFATKDLNIEQWIICIAVSSLVLWLIEIVKIFRRRAVAVTETAA
jgi:P-type Ca2+ transporter type 2C